MNDHTHYTTIARAIDFLRERGEPTTRLAEAAAHVGLSEFHFQRLFVEWAGVTPKEFVQTMTLARAKALLAEDLSLLDTSLQLGLSGPARLHDLFVSVEAMTPGDWKRGAQGLVLRWTLAETPFGRALFAATERGLCRVSFIDDGFVDAAAQARAELESEWPGAQLVEDAAALQTQVDEILHRMRGGAPRQRLGLLLRGSPLRVRVWQALMRVPPGRLTSYSGLAARVGEPRAVRSVASCVADNPIAWLVPCHRVIRAGGDIGEYHWGPQRKHTMLAWEQLRTADKARSAHAS